MNLLKTTVMFKTLLFALTSFALFDLAYSADQPRESILLQKINFERDLHQKLDAVVKQLLPPDSYILNVNLNLKTTTFRSTLQPSNQKNNPLISKLWVWPQTEEKNEKPGLDQLIDGIYIDIFIDKSVEIAKQESVKSLISLVTMKSIPYPVQVKLQSNSWGLGKKDAPDTKEEDLAKTKTETPKEMTPKDWLLELKTPIGIILSTIIIFILGVIYTIQYGSLEKNKIATLQNQNSVPPEAPSLKPIASEEINPSNSPQIDTAGTQLELKTLSGLSKFYKLLEEDLTTATYLLKNWIHTNDNLSRNALALITQLLTNNELNIAVSNLSEAEKKKWTESLTLSSPDARTIFQVNMYINNEIISHLMLPSTHEDSSINDLLAEVTPEDVVACANKNPDIASYIFNMLPTIKLTKAIEILDENTLEKISGKCLVFKKQEAALHMQELKNTIQEIRTQKVVIASPFGDKLQEIISKVSLKKETLLFKAIIASGNKEQFLSIGKNIFPAELVFELPPLIIKGALDHFPISRRAELLVGLSERQRLTVYDSLVDFRKLKEILENETEEIFANELKRKRAEKNIDKNWEELVSYVRTIIKDQPEVDEQTLILLNKWYDQISQAESQNSREAS